MSLVQARTPEERDDARSGNQGTTESWGGAPSGAPLLVGRAAWGRRARDYTLTAPGRLTVSSREIFYLK